MTRRPRLSVGDIAAYGSLIALLVGAGIWLGAMETRVTHLEQHEQYLHGDVVVPSKGQR